ncbi:hypothetical protein [Kribbella deserti]|uniref:Uncharacterized protein n=1 Tax=Kribbella deserti TaxID=1926257 RepID=A0ABV6QV75_9ACTN
MGIILSDHEFYELPDDNSLLLETTNLSELDRGGVEAYVISQYQVITVEFVTDPQAGEWTVFNVEPGTLK